MARSTNQRTTDPKRRLRRLQAALTALESGHPSYTETKKRIEQEIELVKADVKPRPQTRTKQEKPRSRATRHTEATPAPPAKKKRLPLPGAASFPSLKLPDPKSPTFYEDSLQTMTHLRAFCKQCVGYMQKADTLFGSLSGVGTSLHKAGVLPKLTQGKFKELTTGDWTQILMALMNSPLSGFLLGPSDPATDASAEKKPEESGS